MKNIQGIGESGESISSDRKPAIEPASETLETLFQGTLHDLYAASPADAVAVNAFGLGLAVRQAARRPIVWGMDEMTIRETGRPYAPGLVELGTPPHDVVLVRARDAGTLLGVAEEALRSPAVGAVVLSLWGESRSLTLTASRRLLLASRTGGTTLFLARAAAAPAPSAAETRWAVHAMASVPMEAGAPGHPALSASLLRHRGGASPRIWTLEWDREQRIYVERTERTPTLSRDLVSMAAQRQAAARSGEFGRLVASR